MLNVPYETIQIMDSKVVTRVKSQGRTSNQWLRYVESQIKTLLPKPINRGLQSCRRDLQPFNKWSFLHKIENSHTFNLPKIFWRTTSNKFCRSTDSKTKIQDWLICFSTNRRKINRYCSRSSHWRSFKLFLQLHQAWGFEG